MNLQVENEQSVAELIRPYMKPLFGFALNKVRGRAEAEDLAQEILLELMKTLSAGAVAGIRHLDAYVWTIARYTWSKWLKQRTGASAPIEMNGRAEWLADPGQSPLEQLIESDTYRSLRREIAFLSDLHRRIVVLYYYEGLKQNDVAQAVGIPVNTVKWHLSDARKELKKRMEYERRPGGLSVNPIRLTGTGHAGAPGSRGETGDFLGRALAQNIVYAAYSKPLTVHGIAAKLGVPPALLEGEIRYLAEYDYLSETVPGKYCSNTIIWNYTAEQLEERHRLYRECAAQAADAQFDALMDVRAAVEASGVYVPDDDYRFLLWTLIPKHAEDQARRAMPETVSFEAAAPKRKDGGHYIAYAHMDNKISATLSFDPRHYEICGTMRRYREGSPLYLWQLNTYWSNRPDWSRLHVQDAEACYAYWNGDLAEESANQEQYAFLLEKGYIRKTERGYRFNAVWLDSPETLRKLDEAMPNLDSVYGPAMRNLYERMLKLAMSNQPKHLAPQIAHLVRGNTCGGVFMAYLLKHLVDNGRLPEPLPHQRKTITTWMGPVK